MICPSCGAENEEGSDRCTTCLKHFPHVYESMMGAKSASSTPTSQDQPVAQTADTQSAFIQPGSVFAPVQTPLAPVAPQAQPVQPGMQQPSTPPVLLANTKAKKPFVKVPGSQTGQLLGVGILSALVVGGIYFGICKFIDLPIIFPLFAGALAAVPMTMVIGKSKIRNAGVVAFCAIITGLMTYVTKTTFEAYSNKSVIEQNLAAILVKDNGYSQSNADIKANAVLNNPVNVVRLFLIISSFDGITISNVGEGSSSSDAPITGGGYWAFLALECLVTTGACVGVAVGRTSQGFCTACEKWHANERVLVRAKKQAPQLVQMAKAQDWANLRRLPVQGFVGDQNNSFVKAEYCPGCNAGTVVVGTAGRYGNPRMFRAEIVPESMTALRTKPQPAQAPQPTASAPATPTV